MLIVIWIICAVVCAVIAESKNRSAVGWFFIGLVLGILGVILVAVLPSPAQSVQPMAHCAQPSQNWPQSPPKDLGTLGEQSVPATIEAFALLHQQGILTDDEFSAKKQELLSRV